MNIFKKKKKILGENILQVPEQSKVELSLDRMGEKIVYKCALEQVVSNEEIIVAGVQKDGAEANLSEKTKYEVIIKTDKGLFQNFGQVVKKNLEGNIIYYYIKFLEETKKIQRRESYRLEKKISFKFCVVDGATEEILKQDIELEQDGQTQNISTGGVKFYSNFEIEEGNFIKMVANIDGKIMVFISKVLYKEDSDKTEFKFAYKCKFELMPDRYAEMLSKYIFEIQRELSKNGKI